MTPKEKAKEIYDKIGKEISRPIKSGGYRFNAIHAKQCALIAIERNINTYTELVNIMSDFSNESRQLIYQLIENEQQVKTEIESL